MRRPSEDRLTATRPMQPAMQPAPAGLGLAWADVLGQVRAWRGDIVLGLSVVLGVSIPLVHFFGPAPLFIVTVTLLFLGLVGWVMLAAPPSFQSEGPGMANRVTFLRAALVVPVAALAFHPGQQDTATILALMGVATLALLLDGVDGSVARRTGRVTAFGARFDMETDALLILVLSILVWQTGQTGGWVLLIGLMRYAFVAAGWYWRWLQAALPPSRRRQALCVVQSVGLLIALFPAMPALPAVAAALGALALLIYSFAVDVLWLHRHRHSAATAAG